MLRGGPVQRGTIKKMLGLEFPVILRDSRKNDGAYMGKGDN